MIRKSGYRFSEKIMRQRRIWTIIRFNLIGSWSRRNGVYTRLRSLLNRAESIAGQLKKNGGL
jgi:hypothetical protein